jgi:hypothetical protein
MGVARTQDGGDELTNAQPPSLVRRPPRKSTVNGGGLAGAKVSAAVADWGMWGTSSQETVSTQTDTRSVPRCHS